MGYNKLKIVVFYRRQRIKPPAFTELIAGISQGTADELNGMLNVYRYNDDPMRGSTSITEMRIYLYSGKEICMKRDSYVYSGYLIQV